MKKSVNSGEIIASTRSELPICRVPDGPLAFREWIMRLSGAFISAASSLTGIPIRTPESQTDLKLPTPVRDRREFCRTRLMPN